jgi:small subunit ribosomal protein S8e
MTKMGPNKVNAVRVRGGSLKYRALRLETGNFSWGTESITRKSRLFDVVYNASNNELVRTKTLVKSAIIQVDATPFRQWYEAHYGVEIGKKGEETAVTAAKKSYHVQKTLSLRQKTRELEPALAEQFLSGRLYAAISSRPGQSGRCDGYVLEGKELEFYTKKMQKKKGKTA